MSTGDKVIETNPTASGDPNQHAQALAAELDWLAALLQARLTQYFQLTGGGFDALPHPPEPLSGSELARCIKDYELGARERVVLALALAPHLRPEVLDLLFVRNQNLHRGFTEFGGISHQHHGGFLPTGETAAFLCAGDNMAARIALLHFFDVKHPFVQTGMLKLEPQAANEPQLSGALQISAETLQRLSTGHWHKPDYNAHFPAKLVTTSLTWDDLVLPPETMDEVQTIHAWMQHGPALMDEWGLARSVKPGYRALFYGPPGTGKTLTATLIGQATMTDVYRIDLSMVVSKYIGETEKNLARVFDQAQSRRWILFFDEADALFGKRTATSSSNDRYANQEVAYLLQRVEDFAGTVILATNLRANMDEAFSRRFQSMVFFPMPDASQRLRLWQNMLGNKHIGPNVSLEQIAERHELAGGAIANVLQYAAIQAVRHKRTTISAQDLRLAIAKELRKEGRTL